MSASNPTVYSIGAWSAVNNGQPTVDSLGNWWSITQEEGWRGSTDSRIAVTDRPVSDGAIVGPEYRTGRAINLGGTVRSDNQPDVQSALDTISGLFTVQRSQVLTVNEVGYLSRWAVVRQAGKAVVGKRSPFAANWALQLIADDPRLFGAPITSATGLPATTGGVTVPFTVPYTITSTVVSGQASMVNPGTAIGPVSVRIDGPVVAPIITHTAPDGSIDVLALSLTLNSGEFLIVDMENRNVLAQGQSSRAGSITSRGWSGFEPGANSWAFSASAYSASAAMTVTATPAW